MTEVMRLEFMPQEFMMKQPFGLRYALFCKETLTANDFPCDSVHKFGHLGDFVYYAGAKEIGLNHPHSVVVRFYPDWENEEPSADFIHDFTNQKAI